MDYIQQLIGPLFTLFIVIGVGMWIGSFKIRDISLGAAGVLFVALFLGHFKHDIVHLVTGGTAPVADKTATNLMAIPKELTELGMLLFVYAVGLQAGPRFFTILKARGKSYLAVGFASVFVGTFVTFLLAKMAHLNASLATGLYTGALTSTPALASILDVARFIDPKHIADVSVGYGLAYPFSVICVTLFVQFLPKLLRLAPTDAANAAREEERKVTPPLVARTYVVSNPNCDGKTIEDIQALHLTEAKISRVKHGEAVWPALPETRLYLGDVILAVGTDEEAIKLTAVIGDVVDESMTDTTGEVASEDVVVSRPEIVGKSLRELNVWERYNIVVTRVRREGIEISPSGRFEFDMGDIVKAVGSRNDLIEFETLVGGAERRLDETSFVSFALGIAIGIGLGLIAIPMPGGLHTQLGSGGGAFIVALLMGHLRRIGPFRVYVPTSARYFAREFGLVIFLAGAGLGAGEKFMMILRTTGPQALGVGAVVTVVSAGTAFLLMHKVYKWNMLETAGALSGTMTNSPSLVASSHLADSDAPAIAFASIYPVAIISKILMAQLLYLLLRNV